MNIWVIYFGAIMKDAAMNTHVQVSVWTNIFSSLEEIVGMGLLVHSIGITITSII